VSNYAPCGDAHRPGAVPGVQSMRREFHLGKWSPVGAKEGNWLEVELDGTRLVSVKSDAGETAWIAEKLARLREGK